MSLCLSGELAFSQPATPPTVPSIPTTPAAPPTPTPAAPATQNPAAKEPATSKTPDSAPKEGLHEVFPGVYADLAAKIVEFDSQISPMLVKDAKAPTFYLEVIACSPNTREHETFVVSRAKPSHIHAAMLAIGLTPGTPGSWAFKDNKLNTVQPTGDRVSLRFVYTDKDGKSIVADPLDWIVNEKDKSPFLNAEKKAATTGTTPGWVFAGSKMRTREGQEVYEADGAGTIIGLTTFGGEVIAWSRVISPDAGVQAPEWIADFDKTPPAGTTVRVRVKKAE